MSRKDDQLPDGGKVIDERKNELLLLPCPFCGSEASIVDETWGAKTCPRRKHSFIAGCDSDDCGAMLRPYTTSDRAFERWNARASEKERDDLRAEVERLRTEMRDAASETGTSTLTHKILREALKEETKGE